jgi:hypothetical protein
MLQPRFYIMRWFFLLICVLNDIIFNDTNKLVRFDGLEILLRRLHKYLLLLYLTQLLHRLQLLLNVHAYIV